MLIISFRWWRESMAFTYSDGMKKISLSLALSQWQMMMNDTLIMRYGYVV